MFKYPLVVFFIFLFGTIIGSFLNALIYRIPLKKVFNSDRSKCTSCEKMIFWYENIPIISYIFLRGRCSKCKSKISLQYPFVELLSGIVALLLFPKLPTSTNLIIYGIFFICYSIGITFIFILIGKFFKTKSNN